MNYGKKSKTLAPPLILKIMQRGLWVIVVSKGAVTDVCVIVL